MRNRSKAAISFVRLVMAAMILLATARAAENSTVQAVSLADRQLSPSPGGNGDSLGSVISSDGRFVLFLGWANNLVTNDASGLNVDIFLRNLTNHTTTLVSVNASGIGGGNGNSVIPEISSDGRRVVFESEASDLVLNDTNRVNDVFVRDLATGTTSLISVNQAGPGPGNGPSTAPVITPDGRFVAFSSAASDLVANDTNGLADIFIRDLNSGTTILASPNAVAPFAGAPGSDSPVLTPDGRYLAFVSWASNLVSGITNNLTDVYVRDLQSGVTTWAGVNVRTLLQSVTNSPAGSVFASNPVLSDDGHHLAFKVQGAATLILRHDLQTGTTDLVSTQAIASGGGIPDSSGPEMTPDGRFIAFTTRTDALGPGNVYLWDAQSGATALVNASFDGGTSTNGFADSPALSADGRFVTFLSNGPDLATNATDGTIQVFVRDMVSGTTRLVSADISGGVSGETPGAVPTISADGRLVAFDSTEGNYVPNDRNNAFDVFVRDTVAGTTELVSRADTGLLSLTGNGLSLLYANAVSADGQRVAFGSLASDLVPNDTNDVPDIFIRDLQTASNLLVSASLDGGVGNGVTSVSAISSNGRYVVFTSSATNLVASDQNRLPDVFVRDLQAASTVLVSQSIGFNGTNSTSANGESSSPVISGDGRYVAFLSAGTDLVSDASAAGANVYWRDLQEGPTLALTTSGRASGPVMSSDGRLVGYTVGPLQQLFVRDVPSQTNLVNGEISRVSAYVLSADGRMILFQSTTNLDTSIIAYDLASHSRIAFGSSTVAGGNSFQISANGRFVTFVTKEASVPDSLKTVFVHGLESATTTLVSLNASRTAAANGDSDAPSISADGRFITYRSSATDIVANDNNGWADVFLFDRLSGTNRLISVDRTGGFSGSGISSAPQISLDGRTVIFRSAATDLITGDLNETLDVFSWSNDATGPVDADGDNMDDNWEIAHFGNGSHDGSLDSDNDGLNDLEEYRAGTDPMDPLSAFAVRAVVQTSNGATIVSWQAAPGRGYRVQFKDDLANPAWTASPGGVTVIGNTASFTDAAVNMSGSRFYRVVVVE